jgi:phosphonatase-like hydrolase
MSKIDLVILDMMGTTVEDRGEVLAAFTTALAQAGVTVTAEQLRAVRGASKRQAVHDLMPATPERTQRAASVYHAFCEELARRYAHGVAPVRDAAETIVWLREQGVRVALNTGFDRDITRLLLARLDWDKLVDAVVCGDEVAKGRPAPYLIFRAMERCGAEDVHRVASVGDTVLDLQAGHQAGVRWNIGVWSGAHARRDLAAAPHTALLASIADLPALLSRA